MKPVHLAVLLDLKYQVMLINAGPYFYFTVDGKIWREVVCGIRQVMIPIMSLVQEQITWPR